MSNDHVRCLKFSDTDEYYLKRKTGCYEGEFEGTLFDSRFDFN